MNEVLQEVRDIIADILALEPDEVGPTARFFEDLGGESIDVLDLSFRCEKAFGIKAEFQKIAAAVKSDEAGRLTSESLETLRKNCTFLDLAAIEADPRAARVTELLTVEAIARYVHDALQARESAGIGPAGDSATSAQGLRPA